MKYFHTFAFPYFRRHLHTQMTWNPWKRFGNSLVIEAVDLRDLPALVVPPEDCYPAAEPHLQRHQQRHRLHAVVASVNIVSHEEIIGVGALACRAGLYKSVL